MSTPNLRKMEENDLGLILTWRNHQEVRRFMYSQHHITWNEHQNWYARSKEDPSIHLLIFERLGIPKGFVKIKQPPELSVTGEWGFYLAPDAKSGSGYELGKAALEYAFAFMKLHKMCGQVLAFNTKSIQFHRKLGFKQEGQLRDQYHDGKDYHDIICFGLISNEWKREMGSVI